MTNIFPKIMIWQLHAKKILVKNSRIKTKWRMNKNTVFLFELKSYNARYNE